MWQDPGVPKEGRLGYSVPCPNGFAIVWSFPQQALAASESDVTFGSRSPQPLRALEISNQIIGRVQRSHDIRSRLHGPKTSDSYHEMMHEAVEGGSLWAGGRGLTCRK